VVQVAGYLSLLSVLDTRTSMPAAWHWHPGEFDDYYYNGQNPIPLGPLFEAWVQPPTGGVILYYVSDSKTLDLLAIAVATAVLVNAAKNAAVAAVRTVTIGQIIGGGRQPIRPTLQWGPWFHRRNASEHAIFRFPREHF
jgi:hypothetical protein